MNHDSPIAITGAGLITALGASVDETWRAILAGRSGLGPMSALEQRPVPDKGGGQAVDLPHETALPRAAAYLRAAIAQAVEASKLPRSMRCGVVVGTTLHGMRAGGDYIRSGDPALLRDFLGGAVLSRALEGMGVQGPQLTTCAACASGLNSLVLGAMLLRAGLVDAVIAGGYDPVSEYSYAGFDSLRLIAEGRPRPFAVGRDGMKVAEGYGVLVLERADDAAVRGAEPLGFMAGSGETADAFHLTQPHPEGLGAADAIRRALTEAGLSPADIDLITAHATATPNNDAAEYAALASVFGEGLAETPAVAFKSHLGHTLGAAGAVELILTLRAMRDGVVPPTAGDDAIDPAFTHLRLIRGDGEPGAIKSATGVSLGFGGSNTAVVVRDSAPMRRHAAPPSETGDDRRPVITGIGLVLPGAVGVDAFAAFLASDPPEPAADTGPIAESAYAHLINARRARRMSEYAKLSLAATASALAHAGAADDASLLAGAAAILGTTHGSSPFCEQYYTQLVREGINAANPVLFAEGVPNAAAAHLSMTFGIRGGCQTIIGTPSAGLDALAIAALRIGQGRADCVVVSAAEEYSTVVNSAYGACGRYGGPGGFVTGSAAATLIVESRAAAIRRGAVILAELGDPAWDGDHREAASVCPGMPEFFSVTPLVAAAASVLQRRGETTRITAGGGGAAISVTAVRTAASRTLVH